MVSENFVKDIINIINKNNRVALDIGANVGEYTELLSQKFDRVYAFEPHPQNICILRERFASNPNVFVIPKAVSNKNGLAKLYCNTLNTEPSLSLMFAQLAAWGYSESNFIEVETITLDTFCQNIDAAFMKIDVEGAENFLFKGAIETLTNKSLRIIMETHKVVDYEPLNELFINLNYKFINEHGNYASELSPCGHFLIYKDE